MSSTKSRKKSPASRKVSSPSPTRKTAAEEGLLNGSASHTVAKDELVHENIFLFWPNIIGISSSPLLSLPCIR